MNSMTGATELWRHDLRNSVTRPNSLELGSCHQNSGCHQNFGDRVTEFRAIT